MEIWRKMRWNKAAAWLLAIVCLAVSLPPGFASTEGGFAEAAESGIEIKAEAGIRGIVKEGEWTRLRLTLTNRTGRNLKGDLVFTAMLPNSGANTRYATAAELPADTPVIVDLTIMGRAYSENNNRIGFYENGVSAGKSVALLTNKPYLETMTTQREVLGVLARDPDTFNFMPTLNSKGYDLQVVPLSEAELPERSAQWDAYNVIAVNDIATGSWSEEEIQAILTWVRRGGTLIVSGGAGYAKSAEGFGSAIPVVPEGTGILASGSSLVQLGGNQPLNVTQPATISTGTLQLGATAIAAENGTLLAARLAYGSGQILYAAFDTSLEPFASWKGTPELWAHLLTGSIRPYMPGTVQMAPSSVSWQLDNALDQFPSIQPPKLSVLFLVFFAYLLLVAPVLYLILRKLDRREWAWWIIPLVSIAGSVIIFSIGAADKNRLLAQSLRTVELDGKGEGIRSASAAVFVPRGGIVKAEFEPGMSVFPYDNPNGGGGGGSVQSGSIYQTVREGEQPTTSWNDVSYWSIRKTLVQDESAGEFGKFGIEAAVDKGNIKIGVTNLTGVDLSDVYILSNGTAHQLGDMEQNISGEIAIPVNAGQWTGYYDYGDQMFPFTTSYNNGSPILYERHKALINDYANRYQEAVGAGKTLIVGFSSDDEAWFEVNGRKPSTDNLTLWVQPLKLEVEEVDGRILILPSQLEPVISKNETSMFQYNGYNDQIEAIEGALEFEYILPLIPGADYEELTLYERGSVPAAGRLSIWNEQTGEWEPLTGREQLKPANAPKQYITGTNVVRLRFEAGSQTTYMLPAIGMSGKAGS